MSQILLNMAQQAIKDPALMAGLIDTYTKQTDSNWASVAGELQISPAQLAKLALCRQPNGNAPQELRQISDYVKMSPVVLNHFYERAKNGSSIPNNPSIYSRKTVETSKKQTNKQRRNFSIGSNFMSKRFLWATGLVVVLLLIVSAFVMAQSTAVSEATLIVNDGEVTISRAGSSLSSAKSYTAVSGEAVVVTAGDTLTTGDTTTAQLHLADGGTVDLFAATSVEITELVTTEETYQVTLTMLAGRTLNRVVHLLGIEDHYEVRSPSSTASVRGTVFSVDVLSLASTHVVVDEGVVNVAMGDQHVDVKAGFEVTAVVGEQLIVKPQHQETPPPAAPTSVPTPVPTPTEVAPTAVPTAEPEPTDVPEVAAAHAKSNNKWHEVDILTGLPALPPAIGSKTIPDEPINPATDGNDPTGNPTVDPTDDPTVDPEKTNNGGNPNSDMVVPGKPPGDGQTPEGGSTPPGQGGTPPGQSTDPGNSGNSNGGKKDK
ncbi:MAG: FecR domain-containing protein [Anaerolineae bacterium]|nr:FecR domain-containing protein [Anaerolineae bacterium]